jgi:hypothetical protein
VKSPVQEGSAHKLEKLIVPLAVVPETVPVIKTLLPTYPSGPDMVKLFPFLVVVKVFASGNPQVSFNDTLESNHPVALCGAPKLRTAVDDVKGGAGTPVMVPVQSPNVIAG